MNDLNYSNCTGVEKKLNFDRPADTFTSNLTLTDIRLNASGTYRCQVTVNRSDFRIIMQSQLHQLKGIIIEAIDQMQHNIIQLLTTFLFYSFLVL